MFGDSRSRNIFQLFSACVAHEGNFIARWVLGFSLVRAQIFCSLYVFRGWMQQQPEKLRWRDEGNGGLSASTFGMALGFCGRISDYVTYVREIVGTPMEFKGNEATAHGCRTESKARACYELITGHHVHDGGFFTSEDRILACSPDGIVAVPKEEATPDGGTSEGGQPSFGLRARRRPFRLLEIKSPFKALYDGSRKLYQPHGIPLHYMCQMQGQMAISGAEECDFFVFLDTPGDCQVVCWRVQRSKSFWDWCEPKLRLVSSWIRDGLPKGIDRTFRFERFDFSTLDVRPLAAPFSVTHQWHFVEEKRFGFFVRFFREEARRRQRQAAGDQLRLLASRRSSADARSKFQIFPRGVRSASASAPARQQQMSIYDSTQMSQQCGGESAASCPMLTAGASGDLPSPAMGDCDHSDSNRCFLPPSILLHYPHSFSSSTGCAFPFNSPLTWDAGVALFGGAAACVRVQGSPDPDGQPGVGDVLRVAVSDARGASEEVLCIFSSLLCASPPFSVSLRVLELDWERSVAVVAPTESMGGDGSADLSTAGVDVPFHVHDFWRRVTFPRRVITGSDLEGTSGGFVSASALAGSTSLGAITPSDSPAIQQSATVVLRPPSFLERPTKAIAVEASAQHIAVPSRRVPLRTVLTIAPPSTKPSLPPPPPLVTPAILSPLLATGAGDGLGSQLLSQGSNSFGAAAVAAEAFRGATASLLGAEVPGGLQGLVDSLILGGAQQPNGPTAAIRSLVLLASADAARPARFIVFGDEPKGSQSPTAPPALHRQRAGEVVCAPVSVLEALYSLGLSEGTSKECAIGLDSDDDEVPPPVNTALRSPQVASGGDADPVQTGPSQDTLLLQAKLSRVPSAVLGFARGQFCEEEEAVGDSSVVVDGTKLSADAAAIRDFLTCPPLRVASCGSGRAFAQKYTRAGPTQETSLRGVQEGARGKFSILSGRPAGRAEGATSRGSLSPVSCPSGPAIDPHSPAHFSPRQLSPDAAGLRLVVAVGLEPPTDKSLYSKCAFLRHDWGAFVAKMLKATIAELGAA